MATERRTTYDPHAAVIALDLGGTKLASCLFTLDGTPHSRGVTPLDGRRGGAVGELIADQVRRLCDAAQRLELKIRAAGVAVPGIAAPETGRVWAPNIPEWDDYPLAAEVQAAISDPTAPVVVDGDRAAYILGEAWQGAARGCRDAIFLAVGTGIGAGILADGRVLRGASGAAGAIGWLALDRPFHSGYSDCGCFESHASGAGLARQLADAVAAAAPDYRGPLRADGATARDLFDAHQRGDPVASEVIARAVEFWGMACANLVSLFNPEVIILGGGVFGPALRLVDDIAEEARRWAQPISMRRVRLEASQLGGDAGLYGAGYLALLAVEEPGMEQAAGNSGGDAPSGGRPR